MVNYRSVTIEIEVKDWCRGTELGVNIEIVASKSLRNIECNTVLARHCENEFKNEIFTKGLHFN